MSKFWLTNNDLPIFPLIGDLITGSELGEGGASHDVDHDSWDILLVRLLLFVSTMPATITATEMEKIKGLKTLLQLAKVT